MGTSPKLKLAKKGNKMLTPGASKAVKLFGFVIFLVVAGFLLNHYGVLKKLKPKASANVSAEVKKAIKGGAPYIKVGVVTWGGYAGGEYYNGGFKASETSRYFKEQGILVDFILIDDFKASRDAWKSGDIDVLWGTTDSYPTEVEALKEYEPQAFMQADYSRGGDAIVTKNTIATIQDLKGKKVAVATGTPSHSFLLISLSSANMSISDIIVVGTGSAVDAAQQFKAGAVDAAVVWSPDDEDCIKSVPGAKVLLSTKKATNVIADHFIVKKKYLDKNKEALVKLATGWMIGAAEINTSPAAKQDAINILVAGLKIDAESAKKAIENVRLATLGDNQIFFGLKPGYKGEELYNKMSRMFASVNLCGANLPPWRTVSDSSIIAAVKVSTPGSEAEGQAKFAAPKASDETAKAYTSKGATVVFASGSATLDDDAKIAIDTQFANTAKEFSKSRIRIEGNTDAVGSLSANKALSKRRAQAVATYLAQKYNFDTNRFIVVGNGPSKPVCNDTTEACYSQNRRTDFSLLEN
jgi:NitT/TauT family transport system substrate-binding protein